MIDFDDEWNHIDNKDDQCEENCLKQQLCCPHTLQRMGELESHPVEAIMWKLKISVESWVLCLQLITFSPDKVVGRNIFKEYAKLWSCWEKNAEAGKIDMVMEAYDLDAINDDLESESTTTANPANDES